MTKAEALFELICDYSKDQGTKTGYRNVCRALNVLGIEGDEKFNVLVRMNYHNYKTPSEPYEWLQKALTK